MEHAFFFDADEELALLKKQVIHKLSRSIRQFEPFFRAAHQSRKHSAHRRRGVPVLPLDTYTIDGLLFLLTSRSLLDGYDEYVAIIHGVVASNYKLDLDRSLRLVVELDDLYQQDEIIISYCYKMKQRKDAMLRTHKLEQVMELYRRHLAPRYYKKKNLGQVFTPFPLIDKILDQIPNDVMTDPASTFLDPSAGMGGFLVCLYRRLMGTLSGAIPNQKKRHHHIVSKMLFAAEITGNNVALMRKVFGDDLHIYHGDALQMNLREAFGLDGVRVIVGNPPFEKPQEEIITARGGGDSLWPSFVRKCLEEWLLPDGYFGMLIPPGWRKPSDEKTKTTGLWELMTVRNTPMWIEMYDDKKASAFFENKVAIRADLVMVKKQENRARFKTRIRGTDDKQYKEALRGMPFLPNARIGQWKQILTREGDQGVSVFYSSSAYQSEKKHLRKQRGGRFRFPVIHSIHKDDELILLHTDKKLEKGGFGVPKVVFNRLGYWNKPFLDADGSHGMTQSMFAIPIRSTREGREIVRFFTPARLAQFGSDLNWSTSQRNIDWKMFRHFRDGFWRN